MFSILAVKHERMVSKMKKLMTIVLGMMCAVGMAGMAIAGNIDSPGPPSSGSGMYSLKQVWDYLSAGTVPTIPGSFQEPSAGPGSTMKTTTEIVAAVATPFAQANGPAVADVKKDVKFFSTASGSWGVKTGTMAPAGFGTWASTAIGPGAGLYTWVAPSDGWIQVVILGSAPQSACCGISFTGPVGVHPKRSWNYTLSSLTNQPNYPVWFPEGPATHTMIPPLWCPVQAGDVLNFNIYNPQGPGLASCTLWLLSAGA